MEYGKLYAIGVGPGNSDFITIKAVKILSDIDIVFYPESNGKSTALNIVKEYINTNAKIIGLNFPMIKDKQKLNIEWKKSSLEIINYIKRGANCAFITLGDVSFYSTYSYIKDIIAENGYKTEIIPGITSFSACASYAGISLAEHNENVVIIPYLHNIKDIKFYLHNFESIILMKVYKDFNYLKDIILENNLIEYCTMFSNIGMENESIFKGKEILNIDKPQYFTTLIIRKTR